jgi:FKBP-type peptidyl-prolyl cis-trans isomerase FkpA
VSELQKINTVVGDGKEAIAGCYVDVHYTGWLFDDKAPDHKGQKFDSSLDRGQLFSFTLGSGNVIQGWDQGVQGMKIGGKCTLIIPSEMGYGARGAGGVIPPNATLVFDVELHGVN